MWWWVWTAVALLLLLAYVTWLSARLARLHRRAETATAALDASLVRRAAAAALFADELAARAPGAAADLATAARAALDAGPAEREAAENDLTQLLRQISEQAPDSVRQIPEQAPDPVAGWPSVVTASRRVGLARQVHTDLVRDALTLRRRVPVRVLGLARRHPRPAYFDVGDPVLDGAASWTPEQATG